LDLIFLFGTVALAVLIMEQFENPSYINKSVSFVCLSQNLKSKTLNPKSWKAQQPRIFGNPKNYGNLLHLKPLGLTRKRQQHNILTKVSF
jgi:hypothetical protein